MTAIELLREAARLMRERAEAATDGPWWSDDSDQSWRLHGVAFRLPSPWGGAPEQIINKQILKAPKASEQFEPYWPDAADAAHMVPMLNPAVALAVAEWLDLEASMTEKRGNSGEAQTFHAVAVACAYLGMES